MTQKYTLADVIGDAPTASAVESMTMMATCIDRAKLARGIENCEMATTIGPILAPTACLNGGLSRAETTRRVLLAADRFVGEIRAAFCAAGDLGGAA